MENKSVKLYDSIEDQLNAILDIAHRLADLRVMTFDFEAHLEKQRLWSEKTFGPGARTAGIIEHIRKEIAEVEEKPDDISEWVDIVILALDGAWRMGASPTEIIQALVAKQAKNEARVWPDWRTVPEGKAIEHDRSFDE